MTCPSNHQHEQAAHIGDVGVVFLVRRKRIWQQSWEGPALGNITLIAGGKISWSDRIANPHFWTGNPKRLPIVNEGRQSCLLDLTSTSGKGGWEGWEGIARDWMWLKRELNHHPAWQEETSTKCEKSSSEAGFQFRSPDSPASTMHD